MTPHIPFGWYLNIFRWQDAVEILLCSAAIFYISAWLQQDNQKPLLAYFYSYCSLTIITFYAKMNTINTLLILFFPLIVAVFILVHHETLQKNFVSLHRITPTTQASCDWINTLIRASLIAAGNNQAFLCVIEKKEALDLLLAAEQQINAPLSLPLLETILQSTLYHHEHYIWIDAARNLKAFNAEWKTTSIDTWLLQNIQTESSWLQHALFFTKKSSALVLASNPATRTFSIVYKEHLLSDLSAQAASVAIAEYIDHSPELFKGDSYGFVTKKTSSQQHRS